MASASPNNADQLKRVFVSCIEGADKMFLVNCEDESKSELISNRIKQLISHAPDSEYFRLQIDRIMGMMDCVALFNGRWCRILNVMRNGDVYLEFTDNGNIEIVKMEHVRAMPDDPWVRSTKRLSGDLQSMNNHRLMEILHITGARMWANIESIDPLTGQFPVTLYYDDEFGGLKNVNEAICFGNVDYEREIDTPPLTAAARFNAQVDSGRFSLAEDLLKPHKKKLDQRLRQLIRRPIIYGLEAKIGQEIDKWRFDMARFCAEHRLSDEDRREFEKKVQRVSESARQQHTPDRIQRHHKYELDRWQRWEAQQKKKYGRILYQQRPNRNDYRHRTLRTCQKF